MKRLIDDVYSEIEIAKKKHMEEHGISNNGAKPHSPEVSQ